MVYDALIVGGGHNGLVCGAYLARAGQRVAVLERREIVGGAVMTEPLWPGFRVDTCSVLHVAIHTTPIVDELDLERFGLRYLPADPWAFAPLDEGGALHFYRDLDRTCQSIALAVGERDAAAYRAFVGEWLALARPLFELFNRSPTLGGFARGVRASPLRALREAAAVGDAFEALKPYARVLEERFESPSLRAALAWLGAQSGTPPHEPGGVGQFVWLAMLHAVGAWHPVGGSGMLATALARCVEHYGGTVRTRAEVGRILLSAGAVSGVELVGGERVETRRVIGAGHLHTMMLDLLPEGALDATLRRRIAAARLGSGTGMTLRIAARGLPRYPALGDVGDDAQPAHYGMQLYCPTVDYLSRAYHQSALGLPPDGPAVMLMSPSAYDRTIAPEGEHSLYFWAQWHPYTLTNGECWEEIERREAEKLVSRMARVAPGLEDLVDWERSFIQSPLTLERRVGLRGGNVMHLEMSLDQLFGGRPLPELSRYATPIEGLYLTGAGTHPGGGVFGAPGRNCAQAILARRGGHSSSIRS